MFACEKNEGCIECVEQQCDHWIEVESISYITATLNNIVNDALNELDVINSNGDLDYNVYVDIHNIIGNIYNRFIEE